MDIKTKFDIGDIVKFDRPPYLDAKDLEYKVFSVDCGEDAYSEKWITYSLSGPDGEAESASEWSLTLVKRAPQPCTHASSRLEYVADKNAYKYADGLKLVSVLNKFCPECGEKLS